MGKFELFSVSDGCFFLDGGTMFGVVPKILWSKIVQPDELNRVEIPLNCLLVRTGAANILIDSGIGNKLNEKLLEIYSVKQEKNLEGELRSLGLQPEDIDFVVNTHLHFDHCGWNTIAFSSVSLNKRGGIEHKAEKDKNHSSMAMPAFPNAKYVIQKQEWYDATHPNERTRASYFKENFVPLKEYGQLLLVDGEYEIVPGVKVINTIGHTKGHQSVMIESEGKKAIYWGDFIPTSAHIKIPYHTSFDLYPMDLVELKKKYLRQAIDEQWLMVFEHDLNVVFAYLVEENGKQILKPIHNSNSNTQDTRKY
ncbi:MAG: MBL fold metallo-hydrolase [bacterium]